MNHASPYGADNLTDAQRAILGGGDGTPTERQQMWGSQFLLPPAPVVAPGLIADQNYINLEFRQPRELLLEWHFDPATSVPTIECKAVIGNGRSSRVEVWTLGPVIGGARAATTLRRVVTAQSLQVSAHRTDTTVGDVTVHIWSSVRVTGSRPVVIATEIAQFGAGVAIVTLLPPPPNATHAQTTTDAASTNIDLLSTQPGSIEQHVRLLNNRVPAPSWPIDPRSNSYRIQRNVTAAAGTCEVRWLR